MLVDVCFFGNHLDLKFNRADLQIGNKTEDNALLLSGTSKQKVDWLNFQNLDIPVICCVDDTIGNLLNRKIILQSHIPAFFLLWFRRSRSSIYIRSRMLTFFISLFCSFDFLLFFDDFLPGLAFFFLFLAALILCVLRVLPVSVLSLVDGSHISRSEYLHEPACGFRVLWKYQTGDALFF